MRVEPDTLGIGSNEVIRIRKYPNRRLYDTSRSCHLTHDGVLAVLAEGKSVQVTDSRSGADITNAVLLQILIERDPARIAAVPSALIHRAMRCDTAALKSMAEAALAGWRGGGDDSIGSPGSTGSIGSSIERKPEARATQGAEVASRSTGNSGGNDVSALRSTMGTINQGNAARPSPGSGGAGTASSSSPNAGSMASSLQTAERPKARAKRAD